MIERFLADALGFAVADLYAASPLLEPFIDRSGVLHTPPFAHGLEAFLPRRSNAADPGNARCGVRLQADKSGR